MYEFLKYLIQNLVEFVLLNVLKNKHLFVHITQMCACTYIYVFVDIYLYKQKYLCSILWRLDIRLCLSDYTIRNVCAP